VNEGRPLWIRLTAAVLLGVEALAVVLRGRGLLGLARLRPRHGFGVAALLLLLAAAVLLVFAGCVGADLRWARIGGAVAQALLLVGSVARLRVHPLASLIGLLVELSAAVLLLVPTTDTRTAGPGPPPPGRA
jgi:hypothetical protein